MISASAVLLYMFRTYAIFDDEDLLAPLPTPKLEEVHPLSTVRDTFINIFAATSALEAVPPSSTWGSSMPFWQGRLVLVLNQRFLRM